MVNECVNLGSLNDGNEPAISHTLVRYSFSILFFFSLFLPFALFSIYYNFSLFTFSIIPFIHSLIHSFLYFIAIIIIKLYICCFVRHSPSHLIRKPLVYLACIYLMKLIRFLLLSFPIGMLLNWYYCYYYFQLMF